MDPNMMLRYYDGLVKGLTIYRIEKRNTNQREQQTTKEPKEDRGQQRNYYSFL